MKRITSILPLLAVLATILIGGVTVGATAQGGTSEEAPCGLRRMLQTFESPGAAKHELTYAVSKFSHTRLQ